jgi:hypothetical protein
MSGQLSHAGYVGHLRLKRAKIQERAQLTPTHFNPGEFIAEEIPVI